MRQKRQLGKSMLILASLSVPCAPALAAPSSLATKSVCARPDCLFGGPVSPSQQRAPDRPRLETKDARELHDLAAKIAQSNEITRTVKEMQVLMQRDPQAQTSDGQNLLQSALHEIARSFILQAMTLDTQHPQLIWWNNPPYSTARNRVSGSRFALDNPDNINQIASLDPALTYVIRGHRRGPAPAQVSFVIYEAYLINTRPTPGIAEEGRLIDPDVEADGSYTVTIGPGPAAGRKNYIQNSPEGRFLLVRQTQSDWSTQNPDVLDINVESGSSRSRPTQKQYIQEANMLLRKGFPYWLKFQNETIFNHPANTLNQPILVDDAWRFTTMGHFKLERDEALIVTVDSLDAKYVAFEVGDPWLRSLETISRSGSLNTGQARQNIDGSYTYVVSAEDPGAENWVDTGGLRTGTLFLRWQALPIKPTRAANPIRDVRVVNVRDVAENLPTGQLRMSPAARQSQRDQRATEWKRRLMP